MSAEPPAPNGTTSRTVRVGQPPCARAAGGRPAAISPRPAPAKPLRVSPIVLSSPLFFVLVRCGQRAAAQSVQPPDAAHGADQPLAVGGEEAVEGPAILVGDRAAGGGQGLSQRVRLAGLAQRVAQPR